MHARSFTVNNKGYCICEYNGKLILFMPDQFSRDLSLREIVDILMEEAVDARDYRTIEDVCSIFTRGSDSNVLDGVKTGRLNLRGRNRKKA